LGLGWLLLVVDRTRHGGILNATGAEKQEWRNRRDADLKAARKLEDPHSSLLQNDEERH